MASKKEFSAQVIIHCDICGTENKINWKCLTCSQVMCDTCEAFHRTKALEDHKVVIAGDIEKYVVQERIKQAPKTKCQEHKGEYLHMLCKQCNILVCHTCISKTHSGHTFATMQEIYPEMEQELQRYMSIAENKLTNYNQIMEICDLEKTEVTKQRKQNSKRVKERYRSFHTYLDEAMEEMETQLQKSEFNDHKRLDDVRKRVVTAMKSVRAFNQTCNQKLSASPTEMFSFLKVAKLNHAKQQLFSIPQLSGAVFKPGYTNAEEVASHLGSIVVGRMQNVPDFQATVESSFKTKDSTNCIIATNDDKLWLGTYKKPELTLVDIKGKIITSVNIGDPLCSFTLNTEGTLLVTHYHGYEVKKMLGSTCNLVNFYDASPFITYGITASRKGDILVGLYDYEGNKEGKIIRLSPTGRMLQIVYGLQENKETIFEGPLCIAEARKSRYLNIINITIHDEKHVVCIDWHGKVRMKYKGLVTAGNDDPTFCPVDIVVDEYGNILVVDRKKTVQLLDSKGKFIRHLIDVEDPIKPNGICIDRFGNLWVTDFQAKTVHKIKYVDSECLEF